MVKDVQLVRAFGFDDKSGSLVGVSSKQNLSIDEKQLIAFQVNLSETVFIEKSNMADFKFEFFTPLKETDLCGIGILGGFIYLLEKDEVSVENSYIVETKAGLIKTNIDVDKNIFMEFVKEDFFEFDKKLIDDLLKACNLNINDIFVDNIEIVSVGVPKVLIEVRNLNILEKLNPDMNRLEKISKLTNSKGFYFFTRETKFKENDFHARQFNPLMGIYEDPITGVAAGALGLYMKKHNLLTKKSFKVEQGFIMNHPGIIKVDISDKIQVGGTGFVLK